MHCGICDVVCPDLCFVWDVTDDAVQLQGIDYHYCKGCMRCTAACPTGRSPRLARSPATPRPTAFLDPWLEAV